MCLRLREQYLCSKITSVARVAHVLLLRPISGNMDVNMLASKLSELIGNAEIVRMRRVIHNNSTCVCLRLPVAAITQKRKLRPVAGFRLHWKLQFRCRRNLELGAPVSDKFLMLHGYCGSFLVESKANIKDYIS